MLLHSDKYTKISNYSLHTKGPQWFDELGSWIT